MNVRRDQRSQALFGANSAVRGGRRGVVVASRLLAWIAVAITASSALAAEPCGGLLLDGSTVQSKQPLPAKMPMAPADLACVDAVAKALQARTQVRSVTIAVRVASDQRALGGQIAAIWSKQIIAAGVPEARVSTIVPTGAPGTASTVSIAFREPTRRPVALVQALTGQLQWGADPAKLGAGAKGTTLTQGDHAATGTASVARLALADGSFLALAPNTLIKLGRVELTRELKRAVRIELLRGKVEAIAEPKGEGRSFDVITRTAVAGVRGTRFRVGLAEAGATSVETLQGAVELRGSEGSKEAVMVSAGQASKVEADGKPTPPRSLLPSVVVEGPLQGAVERNVVLRWTAIEGARGYRVEFGADGEIATEQRSVEASTAELALPKTLPAGRWYWRVVAVDAGGFVGMPSKTYSFTVAAK